MFKKLISIVLILSCAFTTIIYAATSEYKLRDIDLIAKFPEELIVFTRESTDSNPNFDYLDVDAITLTADMEQKNMYLYAFNKKQTYDITIVSTKINNEDENYDSIPTEELEQILTIKKNNLVDNNSEVTILEADIYNHSTTPMIMFYTSNSSINDGLNTLYMLEFTTLHKDMTYSIKFQSYGKEFTIEEREMFEDIIDDLEFKPIKGSSTHARILAETVEFFIGFAMIVALLLLIIFIMNISKKNKKKHYF